MEFKNRTEAAKRLAEALISYRDEDIVIYALPRGGVVLGRIIADTLQAPLDLIIARKIGYPLNEEFAIGAVTENSEPILREDAAFLGEAQLAKLIDKERAEAKRRRERYLVEREAVLVKGKIAIVVDDGLATGLTMEAAVKSLQARHPKKIVVAIPIAPADTIRRLELIADDVVALFAPGVFSFAIGTYYKEFPQLTDDEVLGILKKCD